MNMEKRQKLIEAFSDFALDYADCIIKDSDNISNTTEVFENYIISKVTFSLDVFQRKSGDIDVCSNKHASELESVFIEMCRELKIKANKERK